MISLLWKSFYDAKAYDVALKTWKLKSVLYFFFVSLIASIFADLSTIPQLYNFLKNEAETISSQVPNCKITEAGFELESDKPIYVTISDGKEFIAFTQDFIPADKLENLLMAFEKTWVTFNLNGGLEKRISYAEILKYYQEIYPSENEILINPASTERFIDYIKELSVVVFPLLNFVISLMTSLLMVFSVTIPTYILSLSLLPEIKLFGAIKVALIASTPAIILSSTNGLFSNFSTFVFAILSFVIVWRMMHRIALLRLPENS